MLPNKVPYDGPKTFQEIVKAISIRYNLRQTIVAKVISYFLWFTIFNRFKDAEKISLKGIGLFNPWKSTRTLHEKGKKLIIRSPTNKSKSTIIKNKWRSIKRIQKTREEKFTRRKALREGWD